MWNEPTEQELAALPRAYATERVAAKDKVIHLHFFLGGCDWYAAEYDPARRAFFGYAILDNAEWGYVSLDELRAVSVRGIEIDRDLHWEPRKASEIERIVAAYGHRGQALASVKRAVSDDALSQARAAIKNDDNIIYDVAAHHGQIVGNVKRMDWFERAVAEWLESA